MKIANDTFKYIYDDLYNITEILKNNEVINKYTYDNRSQLLIDENYDLNKKYVYTYDNEGNILTKKEYNLETNTLLNEDKYEYRNTSWEDQLTKFNNETITYDAIGNPITIGNKKLSWNKGRELSSYQDDNRRIDYAYNQNGIRNVKEFDNGSYINYYLEGNKIIFEERCSIINDEKETNMLYYIYDDSANILGFKYNGLQYYYQKNYQNDITGIYDSNYNLVVTYKYDAWGKVISVNDTTENNIGTINPFRYRSYYYDEETKLYYLNSRYYNPEWCRFINADGIIGANQDIISLNLYAYISNNVCNGSDENGNNPFVIGSAALARGIITTLFGGYVLVKTAQLIYPTIKGCYQTVTDIAENIKQRTPNQKKDNRKKKNQVVYVLTPPKEPENVLYVGRTTDPDRRRSEYNRPGNPKKGLELQVVTPELNYAAARGVEELLIRKYQTLEKGNYQRNQIYGISTKNPYYDYYIEQATEYMYFETKIGEHPWD